MDEHKDHPETWQEALTRRLRTLVRTSPLHDLEQSKARREVDLSGHDLRAYALKAIDAVVERMGLGSGIELEELVRELAPLVRAAEPGLGEDVARQVARLVVEGLLNERERRAAFRSVYSSFEEGRIERRELAFHLLKEEELPDGTVVIRATTEAINLYAGMLEYDVEDAQAADEAVLQSQIRRGRIAQAVSTARQARLRSLEYEQKIVTFLDTARRDVSQVDWVREVLGILEQAIGHLEERLKVEREILSALEDRLDRLPEAQEAQQLAQLRVMLRECRDRHMILHERLIGANGVYLSEQKRQAFRPRPLAALPDLEASVLRAALELPLSCLAPELPTLLRLFQAPDPPRVPHLASLVSSLLAPRRKHSDEHYDLVPAELELLLARSDRFGPDEHEQVAALFEDELTTEVTLSDLLMRARERGWGERTLHLLVLTVLLAFDPQDEGPELQVRRADGRLTDPVWTGDELAVSARSSA